MCWDPLSKGFPALFILFPPGHFRELSDRLSFSLPFPPLVPHPPLDPSVNLAVPKHQVTALPSLGKVPSLVRVFPGNPDTTPTPTPHAAPTPTPRAPVGQIAAAAEAANRAPPKVEVQTKFFRGFKPIRQAH